MSLTEYYVSTVVIRNITVVEIIKINPSYDVFISQNIKK